MKCPHCLVAFHPQWQTQFLSHAVGRDWSVDYQICPSCEDIVIEVYADPSDASLTAYRCYAYPRRTSRIHLGDEVPASFAQDYWEACLVLDDSPKASAALSRRCLQHLLREKASIKKGDLYDEIQQVLNSKQLPSHLAEAIDAVRNIGNFAAHPIKSKSTGEIVDVEPGEAEWNLDTLEGLFDFYFVQPTRLKEKKDKLNQKLNDAGKPEMK